MKNKKIIGSLVVISLVLMLFGSIINTTNLNLDTSTPKISQEEIRYTEIFESIYIDGNFSEYLDYDWASGNGTIFDPYTIEAVSMINSMIRITNVDFFEVKDSSFFNYIHPSSRNEYAGLAIGNSSFGYVQNNIFINCSTGISLYEDAEDIQILNNRFLGSHNDSKTGMGKAIVVNDVISVIIEGNYIYGYYDGIAVKNAEKIYVNNNRIETLFGYISTGLYFYSVFDSSVMDNDFYSCELTDWKSDVTDLTKTSGIDGLQTSTSSFIDCFNITVSGNRFYDLNGNLIDTEQIVDNNLILFFVISLFVILIVVCSVIIIKFKKRL